MASTNTVNKQTLYLAVAAALIVGFLGGVVFSVYRAPADTHQHEAAGPSKEATEAIASLEKAVQANPKDAQALIQLGHAYFDTGAAKQAIEVYTKALELEPGKMDVMTDLGVMYHQDSQHQKALDIFSQVLTLNPLHEQARFNRGVVLLTGFNDSKGALAEWEILVKNHPFAMTPSGKMVSELIEQVKKEAQSPQGK